MKFCPIQRIEKTSAFTLVEVVLAIGIAIGILLVALHFYGQAANLRTQLLQEAERVSTIRLLMDRITADLRAAYAQPQYGFTGDSASMRFVKTEVPSRAAWTTSLFGRAAAPETDLKLIIYGTSSSLEGTNHIVTGLTRAEQPLIETRPLPGTTALFQSTVESETEAKSELEPLTDTIRFVLLWYWDGVGWSDNWDSPDLPAGVEINLGAEPLPEGTHPLDYPSELFRRVIYLPGSRESKSDFDLFAHVQRAPVIAARKP